MSLFKFHNSNSIKGFNKPELEASVDTYNGNQFGNVDGVATPFTDATAAKAGDVFVMTSIIDKPEILNTEDYKAVDGEKLRAINLADYVGQQVDISQDAIYYRDAGTLQAETATVVGTIVTAVAQVETATIVGTIGAAGAGNATVIVTAAGMTGSPKTLNVAVANNDTNEQVAGKIRSALTADADIGHVATGFFTVSGATDKVILTAKTKAANDTTLNISVDNGTCTGLTAALSSANTTAGVATGAGNAQAVITSTLGTLIVNDIAVAEGDNASTVADKIRIALGLNSSFGAAFTVSGATDKVIVTKKTKLANDTSFNVAIGNATCAGLTSAPTSANTTAGVLPITTNAGMYADLVKGDILVSRASDDTDFPMKWKKVASATGYKNYLKVVSKTTFGAFTVDSTGGAVLGGLVCDIM